MKIVLDTNIIISAIIFGGKPRAVFEMIVANKSTAGIISEHLIIELLEVLKIKFNYSKSELAKVDQLILENFVIVKPKNIPDIIKDDTFDNEVLAAAAESLAHFIVSVDNHLLKLQKYNNILIVTPHNFIKKISRMPN